MSDQFIFDEIAVTENGQSNRTVRIAEAAVLPNQLREIVAFMGTYNVRISRMSDDKRAKSFQMSADEMDTLAAQWIRFREDCISAREAEEKRLEEVVAEAYNLATYAVGVNITEEPETIEKHHWTVACPETWARANAYTPDQLLEVIKDTIDRYEDYLTTKLQAKELAKQHPQIKVRQFTHSNGGKKWQVNILGTSHVWSETTSIHETISDINQAITWLENNHDLQLEESVCTLLRECSYVEVAPRRVTNGVEWLVGMHIHQFNKTAHTHEELVNLVQEARTVWEQNKQAEPVAAE